MEDSIDDIEKKEPRRWSKTEPTKHGSKTTSVREIVNKTGSETKTGYLVCVSIDEKINGKYVYKSEEHFSETNPLSDDFENSLIEKLREAMNS